MLDTHFEMDSTENTSFQAGTIDPRGVDILGYIGTSFGCLAILLNILFLSCLFCMKNNNSAYNRFIQNLCICDILGCLSFLVTQNFPEGPFAHIIEDHKSENWWVQCLPYVFRSLPWMFFTAYMLTLNCLSVSQYLASCKPHVYMNVRMNKVVYWVLMLVWLLASLQIIVPAAVLLGLAQLPIEVAIPRLILISKVEMVLWMIIYTSSTILCIVLNLIVYAKLKQLKLRQAFIQQSLILGANTRTKNEAFITIACLCLASILCRLPFPLVGMLLITVIERKFGQAVMSWTLAVVVLLLYLVFVVDPVIYICRLHDARKVLMKALDCFVKCPAKLKGQYEEYRLTRLPLQNNSAHASTSTAQTTLL